MITRTFAAAVLLAFSASPCRAQSPYRLDAAREWALLGSGALLCAGGIVMASGIDPLTAAELASLDPADINSFDRAGMHPYRDEDAADALAASSYLLPFAFLADDDTRRDWQTLAVMWGEATLVNLGVLGVVKAAVQRTRPYAYDEGAPDEKRTDASARVSFYSGHTAGTSLNCFFVARVFSDYLDDRRVEGLLWAGAAAIPAVVAFARVDSGNHFRTDVLTGYVVGGAVGWLVPELHRRGHDRLSLCPATVLDEPGFAVHVSF